MYTSSHSVAAPKKTRKTWGKKKTALVATGAVAAIGGGTAWAAVALFGFGTFNADAATTQNLTVDNASAVLTGSLTPGNSVGAKANVTNPNDFPVTVTGVILRNSTLTVTAKAPAAAGDQANCEATVTPIGTATTWPGSGGGAGTLQAIQANVTIPPGQTRTVIVPQAVKQSEAGTALCGVHADFAVKAQTAS
jgi:hypothetical protein